MRKFASAAGLILLSIAFSVLAGELLARLALEPANVLEVALVEDPVLGYRVAPYTAGHDAFGFRNASVPERADVVAVGDSQTYGVSATREGSWPYQLGQLLGQRVYNMALGGYGPIDYLYLVQNEAPKLHPKQLLVGFYFGNDLMDACWAVQQRSHWAQWRSDVPDICPKPPEPERRLGDLRDWLAKHSVLYGVIKATILSRLITWQKEREARDSPEAEMLWADPADPSVRTIFTPQARHSVLDPKLRGVQEGLRITKKAFAEMRDDARKQGAQLLIVLIPTKEHVYCPYLQQLGAKMPLAYARLCQDEEQVKQELELYLAAIGISYVDVLGPMQEQAAKHLQMYPADDNGHPLAAGYGVIARAVYEALKAH
jgi:lysophospholipase L1-like esterase